MNVGSGGGGAAAAPAAGGAAAAAGGAAEEAPKEEEKEEGESNSCARWVGRERCMLVKMCADVSMCLQRRRSRMKTWASVYSTKRCSKIGLRSMRNGWNQSKLTSWLNASLALHDRSYHVRPFSYLHYQDLIV